MRSKRTILNATGMQALFAVHHCKTNSQAELDSLTIGQLSVSRAGPPIERAVSASRCRVWVKFARGAPQGWTAAYPPIASVPGGCR